MGKERGVFTHSDDGKWAPFPPGSNSETVWKIACGKINAPQAFTVKAAAERTKRKAAQNTPLIRALGLAHYWQRLLDEGKFRSITDIAAAEGIDVTQARRFLRLTLLAPAVLTNPDVAINLESVLRRAIPRDWRAQGAVLAGW